MSPTPNRASTKFSRRERQIMDILYERGPCTVADILEHIPDPPSYSAVRSSLRILEQKSHIKHRKDGPRFLYTASVPRGRAKLSALRHLMKTFFDDSVEGMMATLLKLKSGEITPEELDRMTAMIDQAKAHRKKK